MLPTYSWITPGMRPELEALDWKEVLAHLENHLCNHFLGAHIGATYVNRLAEDDGFLHAPEAPAVLFHLLREYVQEQPFDPGVCRSAAMLLGRPELTEQADRIERSLAGKTDVNALLLRAEGDQQRALNMLRTVLTREPDHLEAAAKSLEIAQQHSNPEPDIAGFVCPRELRPRWLDLLFVHYASLGVDDKACSLLDIVIKNDPESRVLTAATSLMLRLGETERALEFARMSLARNPLQTPLGERIAALEAGNPQPIADLAGRNTVVCIYSFQKADMLQHTLKSLAASEIGGAQVLVLLNGCTDDSAQVVRNAQETLFEKDALTLIELPVNVGAPAARNWLLSRPEVQQAEYVAFLDDDVTLPADWLSRFMGVLDERLGAGVVGGRVLEPPENGSLSKLQYLYRTLSVVREDTIRFALPSGGTPYDSPIYEYVRPTMSVMGCCHLFRGEALRQAPPFDIRYSPSQIDDMDHDIDMVLNGWEVVYCGHVSIIHHSSAGRVARGYKEFASTGNTLGNDVKFFYKRYERLDELRKLQLNFANCGMAWGS